MADARVLSELWAGRFPTVYTVRGRGGGLRLCILLFSSAGVAQAASTAALYKRLKHESVILQSTIHSLCVILRDMRCQQHTPSRTQYMATARILYVILHSTTVLPNKTSHAPRGHVCMYNMCLARAFASGVHSLFLLSSLRPLRSWVTLRNQRGELVRMNTIPQRTPSSSAPPPARAVAQDPQAVLHHGLLEFREVLRIVAVEPQPVAPSWIPVGSRRAAD